MSKMNFSRTLEERKGDEERVIKKLAEKTTEHEGEVGPQWILICKTF